MPPPLRKVRITRGTGPSPCSGCGTIHAVGYLWQLRGNDGRLKRQKWCESCADDMLSAQNHINRIALRKDRSE